MKVFLGGTRNGSTWRNRLMIMLNEVGVEYFNPVVDDWTPECQEQELLERENCDYCLYVITPKMTGVYSIAKLIDDSNKRPGKTVFCFLLNDDGVKFDDGQVRSLSSVADMGKRNGTMQCETLKCVSVFFGNLKMVGDAARKSGKARKKEFLKNTSLLGALTGESND